MRPSGENDLTGHCSLVDISAIWFEMDSVTRGSHAGALAASMGVKQPPRSVTVSSFPTFNGLGHGAAKHDRLYGVAC